MWTTNVLFSLFLFMIFMTSHNVGNFQLLQTLRGRLLWFLLHCKILCAMGKRKPSNTTARKLMYLFYKPWTLVFFPEVKLGPQGLDRKYQGVHTSHQNVGLVDTFSVCERNRNISTSKRDFIVDYYSNQLIRPQNKTEN